MSQPEKGNLVYLIFAGRKHHVAKLFPLYSERAAFYYADNAVNNDPASEFLGDSKYKHFHTYHFFAGDDGAQVDSLVKSWKIPPELFYHVAPFWGMFSVRELAKVYVSFSNVFEELEPKAVFGLHENNFWVKIAAYICQEKGIPHYVFQEGLLRKRDQEVMRKQASACEYSKKLFVWGESSKRQYVEAGIPEQQVVVSGPMHLNHWRAFANSSEGRAHIRLRVLEGLGINVEKPIVTIFLPLSSHFKGTLNDLDKLVKYVHDLGAVPVVAAHPFDKDVNRKLFENIGAHIYDGDGVEPLILATSLGLVQHSTVAMECLFLGTPIAEFNLSNMAIQQSWGRMGLAPEIHNDKDLDIIEKTLGGAWPVDVTLVNEWLADNVLAGDSIKIIEEHISETLRSNPTQE